MSALFKYFTQFNISLISHSYKEELEQADTEYES